MAGPIFGPENVSIVVTVPVALYTMLNAATGAEAVLDLFGSMILCVVLIGVATFRRLNSLKLEPRRGAAAARGGIDLHEIARPEILDADRIETNHLSHRCSLFVRLKNSMGRAGSSTAHQLSSGITSLCQMNTIYIAPIDGKHPFGSCPDTTTSHRARRYRRDRIRGRHGSYSEHGYKPFPLLYIVSCNPQTLNT